MTDCNLPPAERDVLACLHRLGKASSREVMQSLAPLRPMALGSVVTLLRRLEAKKFVTKSKPETGLGFIYQAARSSRITLRGLAKHFVERVFHGDNVALMASLFDTKPPTRAEVEQLQELLDELRQRTGRKEK